MMGEDKMGTNGGGGFLQLFDWNRKSRKKSFASVSPEGTKQASKTTDNSSAVQIRQNVDNENGGLESVKENSDFSCTSSLTEEDGIGTRAPGVVARLMGLDSFPTKNGLENCSTLLFENRPSHDNRHRSNSLGFDLDNPLTLGLIQTKTNSIKLSQSSNQKMPNSPIEKFQAEMLPPRSAKSLPHSHHNLLSPVKNPRFVSSGEAAHIMGAAAKIIDTKFQLSCRHRDSTIGPFSQSLKSCDTKEHVKLSQRATSLPESSKKFTESNTTRQLRGKLLKKTCSASEKNSSYKPSSDVYKSSLIEVKDKGKSISLATQGKVNVHQTRIVSKSNRILQIPNEQDFCMPKQPVIQKNKQQNRVIMSNSSRVLKQNNHKQNYSTGMDKITAKSSVRNRQAKKGSPAGASSGKNKSLNKLPEISKNGHGREVQAMNHIEEQPAHWNHHFENNESFTDILVGRIEKQLHPGILHNEDTKCGKSCRKNTTDVVSFTFNSPLRKTIPVSQPSSKMEKQELGGKSNRDTHDAEDAKRKPKTSLGFTAISGDDLSVLLEQKLRQLTMELESVHCSQSDAFHTSASTLQHSLSATEIAAAENHKGPSEMHKDSIEEMSNPELSPINDQECNFSQKLQGSKGLISWPTGRDLYAQQPSHFSVLKLPCSIESYHADQKTSGSELPSCVEAVKEHARPDIIDQISSAEAKVDMSDSASSSASEIADGELKSSFETEYVRDVLSAADLNSISGCSYVCEILDPVTFQQLENKKSRFRSTDVDGRMKRKVLFDCVNECLDLKRTCYFSTGYRSWIKGVELLGKSSRFVEEIYKEIAEWRGMENWMVDDLIYKDMICYLGGWVHFETDVYATGVEIQGEILSELLDEVVDEFWHQRLLQLCYILQ